MPPAKQQPKSSRVLADHQRQGKTFVPPMLALNQGNLHPFGWIDEMVPELVWMSLLLGEYSLSEAAALAATCASCASDVFAPPSKEVGAGIHTISSKGYVKVSDYEQLSGQLASDFVQRLRKAGVLAKVQRLSDRLWRYTHFVRSECFTAASYRRQRRVVPVEKHWRALTTHCLHCMIGEASLPWKRRRSLLTY